MSIFTIVWLTLVLFSTQYSIMEQLQHVDNLITNLQMGIFLHQKLYYDQIFTKNVQQTEKLQLDINSHNKDLNQTISFNELTLSSIYENNCEVNLQFGSSYYLFQTPRAFYILINNPKTSTFSFFNINCELLTTIRNHQVLSIHCDRGLCDDGSVYILTEQYVLLFCTQPKKFGDCLEIKPLKNYIKQKIINVVVRGKGQMNVQIYIADSYGSIIVLDGQGKYKLTLNIEIDSQISHFIDINPFPLVVSSKNWFYIFENNKYSISLTKCPYLHHPIQRIVISHPYQNQLYALSKKVITKIEYKNSQQLCTIIKRAHLEDPILDYNRNKISEHKGILFFANRVINLEKNSVQVFEQCGYQTQFNFNLAKNNYRKKFLGLKCSHSKQVPGHRQLQKRQTLVIFKEKEAQESNYKLNTVITIIVMIVVVMLIYFFIRSTSPNLDYDEQLKYSEGLRYTSQIDNYILKNDRKPQITKNPSRGQINKENLWKQYKYKEAEGLHSQSRKNK